MSHGEGWLCLSLPALILQKVGESVLNEERSWVPSALILLLTLPCNCRKGSECLPQEAGSHSGAEQLSGSLLQCPRRQDLPGS